MSSSGLRQAQRKMSEAGVDETAVEVFSHYYRALAAGETGMMPEAEIEPLPDPVHLADVEVADADARDALSRTVVIKLNGGLGTSMGMTRAKSLLPVREGKSFLDLIADQVEAARERYDVALPLILMNSFRTRDDSLAALAEHPGLEVAGLPLDFLQSQEPKIRTDDLTPVSWPADESLEWCPPGHGDLYPALLASGLLETLLEQGYRYASVSNADNLGATPDARLAGWFAGSGAPFAMEVCRRTVADRKGGHLAVRRSDDQIVLREVAQTPDEDLDTFTDHNRHRWFNTNSLWFDLRALHTILTERRGVLGLPLIRNTKRVDPTDPDSPEVYQIETAMGAAIEVFPGATAIAVNRSRFRPVKTTGDLLLLRSDAYDLIEDGSLEAVREHDPVVKLDDRYYKTIADFDARFPAGAPSLRAADSLTVTGDWTFGAEVVCIGDAVLDEATVPDAEPGQPHSLPAGTVIEG